MKYLYLIKDDFKKVTTLHWAHFSFLLIGTFLELINVSFGIEQIIKIIFLLIFYRLFFQTLSKLYYTFWSFSFILVVYLFVGIIQGIWVFEIPAVTYSYFLALLCLLIEGFFLSSPIYFPRVSWWEYDFRYRPEIKIFALINKEKVEGRLTDIRRGAGCVILFDDIDEQNVLSIFLENDQKFEVQIMSKRHYSIGRGIKYGVQFKLEDQLINENYTNLMNTWKDDTKLKRKSKFVHES